jgi:hypothetical protein
LKYPPQIAGIQKQLDQFHNGAQPEPPTMRQEQRTVRVIGMLAASVGECREKGETVKCAREIEVRFYTREDIYILTKREYNLKHVGNKVRRFELV